MNGLEVNNLETFEIMNILVRKSFRFSDVFLKYPQLEVSDLLSVSLLKGHIFL